MFIQMDEVRTKFKKQGSSFQKGYFDAFNNPVRTSQTLAIKKEKINQLIIDGKLSKKMSDFYDGQIKGLEDRRNVN